MDMEWQQINGIHGCFFPFGDFSTGNLAGEFQSCSTEPGFPGEGLSFDDRRLNDSTRSLVLGAFFSLVVVSIPFSERRDFKETWLLSESIVISLSVISSFWSPFALSVVLISAAAVSSLFFFSAVASVLCAAGMLSPA